MSLDARETLDAWIFILPAVLGVALFLLLPMLASIILSFTKYNLIEPPRFIGLKNYVQMLQDPSFWKVLKNTIYFSFMGIPLSLCISLVLAIVMNQGFRGMAFFRGAYFVPVITSWVAVGLVWRWLYNPEYGLVNYVLAKIGVQGPEWLVSSIWAMPAVILVNVWKGVGFNMMIFLAGLQGIPEQLYEAAKIDGASRWQLFRFVTFPMLSPTTFFLAITSVIGSFQVFDAIYAMTNGGPEESTKVIVYYLWERGFGFLHMGYASAVAWTMFLLVFALTVLQWKISDRWVFSG